MSYRLINANEIAIKYPEVNDMPCVFADLPNGLHDQFIEERKKGKWINHRKDDGHNIADCDQCGSAIQWFDGDEIPRYCCMCGADMRGESDEL